MDRRAVLGIDAAWTNSQPSGVAVAVETEAGWRLRLVAPFYQYFHALAHGKPAPKGRPAGSAPDAADLLESATRLCGSTPELVAVDMPLSHQPITCRRTCDDVVSRDYGLRHCSTHTPSADRPGQISDDLTQGFGRAGYPLLTRMPARVPGLVEVYPHPALVEFADASMRLRYKIGKVRTYWPGLTPAERRDGLLEEWERIVDVLEARLPGVAGALPVPGGAARGLELKAYEDMLDAVVCVCVGICVLQGKAVPRGDSSAAIWIPRPSDPTSEH